MKESFVLKHNDYKDRVARLEEKVIAIVGYGNQGRSQALNLRDSKLNVIVGSPSDRSAERAKKEGFEVFSINEASKRANIIFLLIPDEIMPKVYKEEVRPALKEGDTVVVASGYNLFYEKIEIPANCTALLVAPRMIGDGVREFFVKGKGVPMYVNVEYAGGSEKEREAEETLYGLMCAIGHKNGQSLKIDARKETVIDLMAEQAIMPLVSAVFMESINLWAEKERIPLEAGALELWGSGEFEHCFKKASEEGWFKQLHYHSHTSQYGQLSRYKTVPKEDIKKQLESAYRDIIEKERFAKEWSKEQECGLPTLKRLKEELEESEIAKAEEFFTTAKKEE